MRPYAGAVRLFALVFVGLGVAIVVQTARAGGGVVGFLAGALFVALGVGRLYLLKRR